MNNLVKIIALLFFLSLPKGYGQQLPQFSQNIFNMTTINPAFAGSREFMVVTMLNRNQWVGLDGAPNTQTFSVHSSVPSTKMGLGLTFINDKLGFETNTYVNLDASYTIDLSHYKETKLAFGVKLGINKFSLNDGILGDPEYNSDIFLNTVNFNWQPNVGFGLYFRGDAYYLGVSSPRLLNRNNTFVEYQDLNRLSFFVNGGYLLDLNKHIKVKPSFLLKLTDGAPPSVDVTTLVYINESIWLGGTYRFNDSFGALINFKVTKGFFLGYAYDYITSKLNNYTSGSHEFMVSYQFDFPKPKCKCKDLYN